MKIPSQGPDGLVADIISHVVESRQDAQDADGVHQDLVHIFERFHHLFHANKAQIVA